MIYEFNDPNYEEHLAELEYETRTKEIDIARRQFEFAEAERDYGRAALWAFRVIAVCLGRNDGFRVPPRDIPEWASTYLANVAEGIYDLGRLCDPQTRPVRENYETDEHYLQAREDWASKKIQPNRANEIVLKILGFSSAKGKNPFKKYWNQMEHRRAAAIAWWWQNNGQADKARAIADYRKRHNAAEKAAATAIDRGIKIDPRLAVKPHDP
jgi:hypothetical protein